MALKVTVNTGKPEVKTSSVGLIKRAEAASPETDSKAVNATISDVVSAVLDQLSSTLQKEADVELELTANVELSVKDGQQILNLDLSGESQSARTLKLKFSTKIQPK